MVKILTSPVQGDVPFGGHKATGLADPTAAQDASTKAYVDAVAQGLSVKASVRAASTANIASQSGLLTVDGVTLVDGDRVLAKDQTTGSTNGIWVAHSGAWTRAADADAAAELVGAFVFVEEGATNAGSGWVQTAAAPITVGTTVLTWTQFSGAGQIVAGAGLAKAGNTLRRTASATGYANLAALPSAAANNGLLERTADGGIYESDGSAWQPVRDPSGTYVPVGGPFRPLDPAFPYARTAGMNIAALAVDPYTTGAHATGRLWGKMQSPSGHVGYTDDDGATIVDCGANPSALSIQGIYFSANFMWLLTGGQTNQSGQVWRSPKPVGNSPTLTWTKVQDLNLLVNGPGGAAGSGRVGAAFRNSSFCVAWDESAAYTLEYGATTITQTPAALSDVQLWAGSNILYSPSKTFTASDSGATITVPAGAGGANVTVTMYTGINSLQSHYIYMSQPSQTDVAAGTGTFPSTTYGQGVVVGGPAVYITTNPGAADPATITWTRDFVWANSKHGHAVKIINGVAWAFIGDVNFPAASGPGNTPTKGMYIGLWARNGGVWRQCSYQSPNPGGKALNGINFQVIPMAVPNVGDVNVIVAECDSNFPSGPVFYLSTDPTSNYSLQETFEVPMPYGNHMRTLGYDPTTRNLVWLGTGEGGTSGPVDSMWMSAPPYSEAVLLEAAALNTFTGLDPVVSNGYAWFNTDRVKLPRFRGQ